MKLERVHKIIAQAGIMSRRKAEEAITEGRVFVNGQVMTELGRLVDPAIDLILIDGVKVELKTLKKTFLFYKPRGVITSKSDDRGRRTVMDYFLDDLSLNPVGRLDFESEGLLLLTHDGDLALRLTHPRYGVKKVYEVEVTGEIQPDFFETVLSSVELDDGPGKFDAIEVLKNNTFMITVSEGRNRFVRRMLAHFLLEVKKLKRVKLGEYELGDLKPGEKREVK